MSVLSPGQQGTGEDVSKASPCPLQSPVNQGTGWTTGIEVLVCRTGGIPWDRPGPSYIHGDSLGLSHGLLSRHGTVHMG